MNHSGHGDKFTRYMWNNRKRYLRAIFSYDDELDRDIKLDPKLTMEHVKLNPFPKMNEVLSQTTANILFKYYPKETHGSAKICEKRGNFLVVSMSGTNRNTSKRETQT